MLKLNTSCIPFCSTQIPQITCGGDYCNNSESKPALDKFIKDVSDAENQQQKKSFLKKLITHPSLIIVSLLPLFIGEMPILNKLLKFKKQIKKSAVLKEKLPEMSAYCKKVPKKMLFLAASAVPVYLIMDKLSEKFKPKHNADAVKLVDNFNKENGLNVKLKVQPTGSLLAMAYADPTSGQIVLDERASEDLMLANIHQKPFLKHELVHMKQYILMACSENGIEKLNYINVKRMADSFDETGKKEVYDMYQEIKNGISDKYYNATIDRLGYKINIVDYITALYKVIYEENTTPADIPIIINKDFYQKIKNEKGKLSPEEEKKAQAYFEAWEKYPKKFGFTEAFNPYSDYRQNLLEKEAYKMNPWYTL